MGGNALSRTDRFGLATDEEIRKAVATLKCANPGEFNKLAKSITMSDMGEDGQGKTDWFNNIQLNSKNYGSSNTPVNELVRSYFLQTMAHEMMHANQNVGNYLLSNQFRASNLFGYFHRRLDDKAEAMITPELLKQFREAMSNNDTGCACTR